MTIPCTRREVLATGAAALAIAASADLAKAPANAPPADPPNWIDAHSHIWSSDIERWPLYDQQTKKDLDPPSFTDDELLAVAREVGVNRVVLIQHSGYHRFDNAYLLDAAKRRREAFRVVGMLDDAQPEAAAKMKALLPQGVTGFRITPFLNREKAAQWLESPGMQAMWRTAATTRQNMCCLIDAEHLPGVDAMCGKHPDTPVVIDHFARIGVDGQMRDTDVAALCRLARHKHVAVKVSAYYALGAKQPPYLDLAPMIRRVLEAFGRERLMWASDAPYQLQKGNDYRSSIELIRDKLDFLTPDDRQWLLKKTAERIFFFA